MYILHLSQSSRRPRTWAHTVDSHYSLDRAAAIVEVVQRDVHTIQVGASVCEGEGSGKSD